MECRISAVSGSEGGSWEKSYSLLLAVLIRELGGAPDQYYERY